MKKQKILFTLPNLNGGGAERVIINIIKTLDKDKFDMKLLLIDKIGVYFEYVPDYVEIISLDAKRLDEKIDSIIASNNLKIGYLGHLYRGRGIDIIIELSKILSDIEFHIVGGREDDIKYWKSQLSNKNIYFHGFIEPQDVYKYRNSFDILLAPYQDSPNLDDGKTNTTLYMSPLKVFEYMSSKKAIITSDFLVLREVLDDSECIFVKADDMNEWANSIKQLQDNNFLKKDLGEKSHHKFLHNFTWNSRSKQILKSIK